MKILKKEMVLKRRQYEHTVSERRILENLDHPFIVSLRFAFQSEHKLYMVFGERDDEYGRPLVRERVWGGR
jgi:serine/threonine protein kinase